MILAIGDSLHNEFINLIDDDFMASDLSAPKRRRQHAIPPWQKERDALQKYAVECIIYNLYNSALIKIFPETFWFVKKIPNEFFKSPGYLDN